MLRAFLIAKLKKKKSLLRLANRKTILNVTRLDRENRPRSRFAFPCRRTPSIDRNSRVSTVAMAAAAAAVRVDIVRSVSNISPYNFSDTDGRAVETRKERENSWTHAHARRATDTALSARAMRRNDGRPSHGRRIIDASTTGDAVAHARPDAPLRSFTDFDFSHSRVRLRRKSSRSQPRDARTAPRTGHHPDLAVRCNDDVR